jgi:hypothetical protein
MKDMVIVIDDDYESGRKDFYELFLKDYDIHPISTKNDRPDLFTNLPRAKLIILDKVLDNGEMNSDKILAEIKEKNNSIPIIMVSRYWNTKEAPVSEMIQYVHNYNIVNFLSWNEWNDLLNTASTGESLEKLAREWEAEIKIALARYKNYTIDNLDDNESLWIVHTGDFQFGSRELASNFGDTMRWPTHVLKKTAGLPPQLIFICGDVTEHGTYEEFDAAREWMNKFLKSLYQEGHQGNIFMVNGNHDCNFSSFAKYHAKCKFLPKTEDQNKEKVQIDIEKGSDGSISPETERKKYAEDKSTDRFNKIIFSEFIEFSQRFGPRQLKNEISALDYVYDYLIPWGIRIICINTTDKICLSDRKGIGIDEKNLQEIMDFCQGNTYPFLYTILLSHYGPYELGYIQTNPVMAWPVLDQFLIGAGVNLWLSAHRHENDKDEIKLRDGRKILYSATTTIRLPNEMRPEDAKKGFKIIELKRAENKIISAHIFKIKIEEGICKDDGPAEIYPVKYKN